MISLNRDLVTNICFLINLVKILFLPPVRYAFIAIYKNMYASAKQNYCNARIAQLLSSVTSCNRLLYKYYNDF